MKRLIGIALIVFIFMLSGVAMADEAKVTLKQGGVYLWQDGQYKNTTTATIIKTSPIDSLGVWNALLDGWTIDGGVAYEDETITDGVLELGREVGTLGKYLPWLIFPFKDKIAITICPVGLYVEDALNQPKIQGCSGFGYIKGELKF